MSNFEDDEALFDDIYADGDQQTTVDTAPTATAEHQEPKQDATSAHPVYNSGPPMNTPQSARRSGRAMIHTSQA